MVATTTRHRQRRPSGNPPPLPRESRATQLALGHGRGGRGRDRAGHHRGDDRDAPHRRHLGAGGVRRHQDARPHRGGQGDRVRDLVRGGADPAVGRGGGVDRDEAVPCPGGGPGLVRGGGLVGADVPGSAATGARRDGPGRQRQLHVPVLVRHRLRDHGVRDPVLARPRRPPAQAGDGPCLGRGGARLPGSAVPGRRLPHQRDLRGRAVLGAVRDRVPLVRAR